MEIFTGIFAAVLLLLVLLLLYGALRDGVYLLLHNAGLQTVFVSESDRSRISAYLQNHPYYTRLSGAGKKRFISRLLTFMYNKEFRGEEGLRVTEEMKVLISAAAVQLTFGLEKFKLANLETIVLFPGVFRLGARKTEYKGATSPQGTMFLSWQSFREGNADPSDKVNLGLHEMTHALKLSLSLGSGFDAYFASRIDLWESMATTELEKLRSKAEEFLRPYGKTNIAEFFAVCVEAFFESPAEFSRQLPELYHYMVFLLNQDPDNVPDDYRVKPDYFGSSSSFNLPVANTVRKSYKYHSWHWSLSLLLFGVLGGFLSVGYLVHHLIVPYGFYIIAFFIVGTIGLLQRRYFENHNILSGIFFYFYSYMGFGISVVTLLLWVNFFIPVTAPQEERFVIKGYVPVWVSHSSHYGYSSSSYREFAGYMVEIENNGWYNQTMLLMKDPPPAKPAAIAFEYRRGIIGIRILEGYHYAALP